MESELNWRLYPLNAPQAAHTTANAHSYIEDYQLLAVQRAE